MAEPREAEQPAPEITWAGRLDGGHDNTEIWHGKISVKDKDASMLGEYQEKINRFYVIASVNAAVRCIDGRGENGPPPGNSNLGPQVPGGTPVTSLAYRISKGLTPEATIESDFADYRNLLQSLGLPYPPGAHEDENNAAHPENTGCGAIDKMLEILKIMRRYDTDERGERSYWVHDYAKAIATGYMEESEFEDTFQDIQVKLQALNGPHFNDNYFQKDHKEGEHRFRSSLVNKAKESGLQTGKKTVETLTGQHNEVCLMVNFVDGQTFDRDGFSADNGGQAQAFNYDVWVIAQRAKDIFPEDQEKQRLMIAANAMYAVGTAMALTDGSLVLGIRK